MPCKHQLEVSTKQLEWIVALVQANPIYDIESDSLMSNAKVLLDSIPKTIQIGAFSVPEPMREKPEYGTYVWAINVFAEDGVYQVQWCDSKQDAIALKSGSLHLTRDNCIAHAKALFSFSEVG